ncbi:hypothetical protein GCM10010124_03900 [Pilimelia terevasa]|uniref:GH26 domain-containing protein n=1 Tax=Pilimelia terevasa TaxID=53372 RepID=A0A8J3FHI6_9ACTN|nr:glycosyl hydrolase [Pilimelia terevasa]GGK14576.1 hypothetical protein GCM10010124_03900 [Pilimelia terevasa]
MRLRPAGRQLSRRVSAIPWRTGVAAAAVTVTLIAAAGWYAVRPQPTRQAGRPLAPASPAGPATGAPGQDGIGQAPAPGAGPRPGARPADCRVGPRLVPTCGVLWGVAPGALTAARGATALASFERATGRTQAIYHAYHRGQGALFPTPAERRLATEPGRPRVLFLNWKPTGATWAAIADGARDPYLDRLAAHLRRTHRAPFFFTVHHEPEDDVRPRRGSGHTAADYAAMYRHVVRRLRSRGVANLVSVVVHLAYPKLTSQPWFDDLYPGDDVVDWVGFDTYAYGEPGYGHGDFAELVNRRSRRYAWPGFYTWAAGRHPRKPLMVAEWGVWHAERNAAHHERFFRSVASQLPRFPRIRAMVYFDTPADQRSRDSRPTRTKAGLAAFRALAKDPVFAVRVVGGREPRR